MSVSPRTLPPGSAERWSAAPGYRARQYQGKFVESNFYHYEFLGDHFASVKGYDAYQQKAEIARSAGLDGACHCERSVAISSRQRTSLRAGDRHAASLLAMTNWVRMRRYSVTQGRERAISRTP